MGEKAMKGKAITKVLSCLAVFAILMSVFSVVAIATDSSNSTASNVNLNDEANSSAESMRIMPSGNSDLSDASNNTYAKLELEYANTSSPGIISESDEVPDPDLPVINDTDIDTAKTVSATSSCSYVWIKITDKYCEGYKVYVDGVYQFTEGGAGGVLDGYCCFKVTPGYHTFKLTLGGKEVSKGWNCQCGVVYNWMSMNDMIPHWCERPDQCKNPPTVNFDKSTYYEGDTVHATVSTIHSSVHYKIKDCDGTVRESGYVYNRDTIYYTIPPGASECCYWEICFYWDEGTPPLGLLGTGGEVTTESYQCVKCYSFYVCPHETPCKVWISVEDKYCEGYKVYVDGGYVLTENGDGYCRFHVTPGTHKFELRKNGCSVSKSWYCQCGTSYRWISMNDMDPHWCECNKPDLVVQDIWWSPSSPKEGDTVTFSVKTKNQGSGNAGGFYVCYYVDGSYYARDYVSSLSAGSTTTTSFSWTADCGSHSIKAVADCYSDVEESNEGNNARTEYINIVCKPDLITQDIYWSPSNPKEGDTVTFSVKTKNQGSENAGGFYVCYYVDGSYYDRDYVSSLSAGSTTTTSVSWTADCGSHSIKAVADCYDAVTESNEGNNARTEYVNIVCKPDLVVQDISWSPSNPKQGDTVTVNVKTKNQGSESVGGFYVGYYVDSSYYTRDYVSSLSAGSTTTTSFTWTADCGNHAIKAVADCYDAVVESDEENNWMSKGGLNIPCKPDLIVQDISWDKGSPKRDDTITFYVKVKNQGSGSAGTSTVKYYIDGSYVTSDSVPSLSAGSTSTQTFTWKANKCGNVQVKAVADATNAVAESNEGNNARTETVSVICLFYIRPACQDVNGNHLDSASYEFVDYPAYKGTCDYNEYIKAPGFGTYKVKLTKGDLEATITLESHLKTFAGTVVTLREKEKKPDLIIQDISWSPSHPENGGSITFTVTVKNQGSANAGSSRVQYYICNDYLTYDSVPELSAGSTSRQIFRWKADMYGDVKVKAIADRTNLVAESNEGNNQREETINIKPPSPEEIKFQGTYVGCGNPMGFNCYYFSVDKLLAGKNIIGDKVQIVVSEVGITPKVIRELKEGDKVETYGLVRNYYNGGWIIDIEGNGYYIKKLNKEKPDLTISDISMSPSSPKQGDDVKFTVTVKNIGKGTAKKSTSLIYLINGDKQTLLFLYFPSCPPLKPGGTHTYTKNAKIEDCGEYGFKAFVDVSKEVDESNEENNRRVASFTVPCTKEEGTLVVNVYSIDGKPAAEVKGTTTIELIKSGDVSPTAKQNINDKSRVTFNDIPIGNYYINVYHNPQLEQGSKESWGKRKDISITDGTTTTINFHRYNPYVDQFYAEKNSVEANTPVKINVGIKVPSNCPDAKTYVKALVILKDESGNVVYRKMSDDREVQKGGSTTFSFLYTPTEEETYYGLAKAYVVGGGELCTDNCGWVEVFNVGEKPKEDYSALIKCISNSTAYYKKSSENTFNSCWWKEKADEEMEEAMDTLKISLGSSTASAAAQLALLKTSAKIAKVIGPVGYIMTAWDVTNAVTNAISKGLDSRFYSDIGWAIAGGEGILIQENLNNLVANGNDLTTALKDKNESRIESLLEKRAYLIRVVYENLATLDKNAATSLKNPSTTPLYVPSDEYQLIHSHAATLHFQLQRDYSVTISTLNNLTEEDYNPFLHEECPEGKIKPQRLDKGVLGWCYGCLDYVGDSDEFKVRVPKECDSLSVVVAYDIEIPPEDTNIKLRLKQDGKLIKASDDELVIESPEEGTYDLYAESRKGSQVYGFCTLIHSGWEMFPTDIQPAWEEAYPEYPEPIIIYDGHFVVDKDTVSIEDEITVSVDLVKNRGGESAWQSIAISSPDIKNLESYTILDTNLDYCEKYDIGYETGHNYGYTTKALKYPLIEGAKSNWGDFTGEVKLKIKPEKEGILRIYAKSVAYGSGVWRSSPKIFETNTKDQQNEYVYVKEITVTGVKHRIKLDISADKTICAPGDIVKLHASVRDLDGNPASATVSYEILGTDIKGTMPGLEGEYSYGAIVPETPGDYLVKITAKAMGDEVSGALPITVLSGNIGLDVSSISVKMFSDSVSSQQITISNIGSADLKEVTLSSSGDVSSWISFSSPEVDWQQSTNSFERISAEGDTDRAVTATITTPESVSIGTYSGEIKIHSLGGSSATIPVTVEVIKHEKEVETDRKSLSNDLPTGWDVYKELGDFEGLGDTYNLNPGPIILTTSKKAVCTFDSSDIGLETVDPLGNMIVEATVISEVDENNDYIAVYVNGKYYDCLNPISGLQEGENSLRVYFDVASAGGVARKNGDNTIEMKASRNIEIEDVKVTPGLYNYESRDWGDSFSLSSDEVENLQSAHLQFDVKAMSDRNMFPVYVYFNDKEAGALTAEWGEGWNEDQKISIDIDEVGSKNSVVLKTYTNGIYNIKNAQFYYTYLK